MSTANKFLVACAGITAVGFVVMVLNGLHWHPGEVIITSAITAALLVSTFTDP